MAAAIIKPEQQQGRLHPRDDEFQVVSNPKDIETHSLANERGQEQDVKPDRLENQQPYRIVEFAPGDPTNPMNFPAAKKWFITSIVTISILAITLTSSAYSSSAAQVMAEFDCSAEVFALGVSLFVLGFAVGPALWAPLSELYGRQILFVTTHGLVVVFVAASAGCNSMASLLVFRFLAGTFGASPMTNSGGVVADLFPPAERGLAMTIFAAAPFMGPVLGPVIGGFITMTVGWRWVHGVCSIFIGVVWIAGSLLLPETYGPVLLQKKAKALSRDTGHKHVSILEAQMDGARSSEIFGRSLKRPWVLLFLEPIVLISSTYLAILYGIIYMFLGAFPIVYQDVRGWNEGVGGLAFLGLAVGMIIGLIYTIIDNRRYARLGKQATPESRLPPAILGALVLPASMFAFAWTNGPDIHWSASLILSAPFGFGCVLVFLSILNYMVDAYTIYAASVLAAGAILRSLFATAFPLFVRKMYVNLGIHWASSIPAFLTLFCMPFPFLVYKYGAAVRMKCKYAYEAASLLAKMRGADLPGSVDEKDADPSPPWPERN
ncbi:major facilitator superfamily domain-containing protein [Corynascus novoguineensis]|uniref:Major facilitator superfamily domain-containing protein n=1 Tax=Corynascus novoguineensis TaxID=1126955 RepID=A0AAN7CL11_9PEZI|nr:major facilitator superfamily domain-containing protein [Corynascus novoguineensis]